MKSIYLQSQCTAVSSFITSVWSSPPGLALQPSWPGPPALLAWPSSPPGLALQPSWLHTEVVLVHWWLL